MSSALPPPLLNVVAAGCGAAVTDTIFNPLEVTKVRMQLDTNAPRLYNGLLQTVSRIIAEEGIFGIWSPGLVATWIRAFTQTGLRVGLYPAVKRMYTSAWLGDEASSSGLLFKIAAGGTTGALGAAVGSPVDMVRVKLQGESGRLVGGVYVTGLRAGQEPSHGHTFAAFRDIAMNEGVKGLWRGASATVARVSLISAGQLTTYDHSKQLAISRGWATDGPPLHVFSSALSGLVAQVVCMPADVVKTRVQSNFYGYRGSLHCLTSILRSEGPFALYRGFSAAAARQIPVMTVQMPIVEQFRRFLGLGYM